MKPIYTSALSQETIHELYMKLGSKMDWSSGLSLGVANFLATAGFVRYEFSRLGQQVVEVANDVQKRTDLRSWRPSWTADSISLCTSWLGLRHQTHRRYALDRPTLLSTGCQKYTHRGTAISGSMFATLVLR